MAQSNTCLDTRSHLLQAALLCFSECGFDGTSLRMVADRAGKNMSLIAHHFKNKEGLFLEVFKFMLDLCLAGKGTEPFHDVQALRADRALLRQVLKQQILSAMMYVQQSFEDPLCLAGQKLWFQEIRGPRKCIVPIIRERMQPFFRQWWACIQAVKPGSTDQEISFWVAMIHGLCMAHPYVMNFNRMLMEDAPQSFTLERAAEEIATFSLRGLGV